MDDAQQRKRFCEDIDHDFSVIAPAGVGKTFSIVERIYHIARCCPQNLRKLCVITYTKKAAEELKNRVSERLQQCPEPDTILRYLSESFFGTIHSLCWQHIHLFDPESYTLLPDDRRLKEQFLSGYSVEEASFREVLRFVDLSKLLELAEDFPPNEISTTDIPLKSLEFDLQPVYDYVPEPRNRMAILQAQDRLKAWESDYRGGKAVDLPECSKGGKGFLGVFYGALEPFFDRLGYVAVNFIKKLAQDYFEYRIQHGYLKHADLVFFAECCLSTERAKTYFSEHPMILLLDEAQDTDEHQFRYIQKLYALNPQNRFSMVGDPQQSIYSRANIQTYLELHRRLVAEGKCEALVFSRTFRCPEQVVRVLNQVFPNILCKAQDVRQVDYVPLLSASNVDGCFKTIAIPAPAENEVEPIVYEARHISKFLENYLRCNPRSLSDICLLVPRKNWLEELKDELSHLGWPLQIYSNKAVYRDNPLFCAVLAFVHLINFPEDGFELAGILHGVFNISETDITLFEQPLQIVYPCAVGASPVIPLLNELFDLRKKVVGQAPWNGIDCVIEYFKRFCPSCDSDCDCEDLILETSFQVQSTECTWCTLENRLELYLDVAIENEQQPRNNALQGFSCHKAKGLEWPTVILPFFYRPVRYGTYNYPFLLNGKVVWNKHNLEASAELPNFRRRELQRLLYVTCTRAKQHLIILNDKALWKPENNHPSLGELYDGI